MKIFFDDFDTTIQCDELTAIPSLPFEYEAEIFVRQYLDEEWETVRVIVEAEADDDAEMLVQDEMHNYLRNGYFVADFIYNLRVKGEERGRDIDYRKVI